LAGQELLPALPAGTGENLQKFPHRSVLYELIYMKTPITPQKPTALSQVIAGLFLTSVAVTNIHAAQDTWSGGGAPDGNWQNAANWGGIAAQPFDQLFFDGSVQTSATNNFAAGTIFGNITFNSTADIFNLYGNSLILTNGADSGRGTANGGSITNSSGNAETINLPITLSPGNHFITANGGGQLNLPAISRSTGAIVQFNPTSGNINLTGSSFTLNSAGILGGWGVIGIAANAGDWATLDASSNVVAYTGYTIVAGGGAVTNIGSPGANANVKDTVAGGAVFLQAGTTVINTLLYAPDGNLGAQTVALGNGTNLTLGAQGAILNVVGSTPSANRVWTIGTTAGRGFITAGGGVANAPGEISLYNNNFNAGTANDLVINSVITNNGSGVVSVNIMGYISLATTNTYSGGTYINQGRVQTGSILCFGTGPVYIYPGGEVFLNANGTWTNDFYLNGVGSIESAGIGAIRMGGTGRILTGRITLTGTAATGNGTINGKITGPGGLIVGSGTANGVGTLILGATNDYSGDTMINNTNASGANKLLVGSSSLANIMPHGAGKGNLILDGLGSTFSATFDLNGTVETINGLSTTATNPPNNFVTSGPGGVLIIGDGDASGSFGGVLQSNLAITKIGSGTQIFTGINTNSGNTTVNGGTLIFATPGSLSASTPLISVNSNATLDVSALNPLTLTASQSLSMSNGTIILSLVPGGNAITTPTLTANGTTNILNITSIPAISTYPATFTAIKYTTLSGGLNFGLGTLPPSPGTAFAAYVSNNVANNSVEVVVTGGPTSVKWRGYAGGSPNSTWDIGGTANWVTFLGSAAVYSDGSFVQFDNSASNGTVTVSQDVAPAGITISNTSLTYTINGNNKIGGAGGILKQGSGTAILDNLGANDFAGDVTISGGTFQIGANDSGGNLPATVDVSDNGTLAFNRSDTITFPNVISGTGTVADNGSGVLVLSAANTFTGAVTVASGATLQTANNGALGTTNGGTIVASGGTLDITANSINLGQEPITISGNGVGGVGALINSAPLAGFVGPNVARVTLAGNTTVGGNGRFDLRANPTSDPKLASLSTQGQPRKLTKVGLGTFGLIGITVDPALGDIEIQQGTFSTEASMTGLGNTASNVFVWPGGTFQMFAITNQINKVFTLGGDGAVNTISATSGAGNTIIGPMNITNDCIFNVNNNTVVLTLNNVISGPGRIIKNGAGLLTISGNSPAYAGGIQENAGNVTINGTLNNGVGINIGIGKFTLTGTLLGSGGLTNVFGSTIAASGTNAGPVDVSGSLNPGDTNIVGTLAIGGGLTLESGATLTYDLAAATTPGGGTNDLIAVTGDLTINGNPITINPLGLLQTGAGNPYRLFTYTGALNVNSPLTVSGPNNYTFTVDTSVIGQVNVIVSGGPPVWTGGSGTTSNWSDPANWGGVTINPNDSLFFAGNNRLNNNNDTGVDTSYTDLDFVAGASSFVLKGNPITLLGTVVNNSSNPQAVALGLDFNGTRTLNGATAPLIIGGGVTNNGGVSTLALSGAGTLTNLMGVTDPNSMTNIISVNSNAVWTLVDNASSTPITTPVQLDVVGGTLNFGQGANAPTLISTADANNSRIGNISGASAALNVAGGTLTIAARLNTGTAANSIAALNQTGGTINLLSLLQVSDGSSFASSTVTVTGGTLNIGTPATGQNFFLASRGTGVVTVASSGVINCATLDMSRNAAGNTAGSVGVVNLNAGGLLAVTRIGAATSASQAGGAPTATFNFNGGTLKARASSTTFYQGNAAAPAIPIVSIVKSGGAIIDTTNFNISILEALQHDSTLGATKDGGLTKLGSGTLTLTAGNTYTGPTLVNEGTLAVNGSLGGTVVTVATNGTLSGTGTAGTNVTVNGGGTLSPAGANTIGTLTVAGNVTLQPNSTNVMELNKISATSDQVRATTTTATTITYGGTLVLTNLNGNLSATDTFKLFSASNYVGAFTALSPDLPGPGLAWNTNTLATDGILRLTATVNTTPTNIVVVLTGNQLNLSWPADHTGWRLQVQTNSASVGLGSNWVDVPGSTSVNSVNFTVDPANGAVFFRMVYP
jgi:fibronectin-binding autotransporter adhesin